MGLHGPPRECVGLGSSVGLFPWAPVRGPACHLISVTQGLAESVLSTEILAKGGQGPEQAAALLSRPGPRDIDVSLGDGAELPGTSGEARGSQGPPWEKSVWIWLFFSFLRAEGSQMVCNHPSWNRNRFLPCLKKTIF